MTAPRAAARLAGLVMVVLASQGAGWAQSGVRLRAKVDEEIAPWRLTGVEGYVQARYLTDANGYSIRPEDALSRTRQAILLEEVFILTHSYIYHPSLLALDVGGGPVIERSRSEFEQTATRGRSLLYNLRAHATVLRDKPYTALLFYDRNNQTQRLGPALEVLTENTRYGLNVLLRSPVVPMPLRFELARTANHGEGADELIDDRTDQMRFVAEAKLGTLGTSLFQYIGTRRHSASGSAGLPLRTSAFVDHRASLDSRLKFGTARQYELANTVAVDRSSYRIGDGPATQLTRTDVTLELRGRESPAVQTHARYGFAGFSQPDDTTTLHTAGAGVTYRFTPELTGSLGGRGEIHRGSRLDTKAFAVDASAQYQKALPLGLATLGYSVVHQRRDQQAAAAQAQVLGERLTLTGTSAVPLGKQQPIASSVVVSNLTRTQTFVEGQDYALSPLGLALRIQRLIGGNILDAEEVLVDYAYVLGGSYALSQLDQTVNLAWAYERTLNLFARYLDSAPRLESGAPTTPVNPGRSALYGLRAEVPLTMLSQPLLLGGSAEREHRREAVLPYRRANGEAYVQADLPLMAGGSLRVGARRMQLDYADRPAQAVDLRGVDLRLSARPGSGVDLSLDATRERDTGTAVARERSFVSGRAQWRLRKLSWSLVLTRTDDLQGATRKQRTHGQMILRRDL